MMLQLINEAGCLILALAIGIYAVPYMNKFTRTLFFQLAIWGLFYIASYLIMYYQKIYDLQENNQVIFNIHGPIELLLLILAASYVLTDKISKWLSITLYTFYIITLALQITFSGLSILANYAISVSGFAITVLYILVLYRKFKADPSSWRYSPEVWASLGLIIHAACNVPYFSIFHYLNDHHPELSARLFSLIVDVLANIRYLFIVVAFWLARKNRDILFSNAT